MPIEAQSWIGSLPLTTPPRWSGGNSPPHTTLLGIDRAAKLRALRALETAGLIAVARRRGRFPTVTLPGPNI